MESLTPLTPSEAIRKMESALFSRTMVVLTRNDHWETTIVAHTLSEGRAALGYVKYSPLGLVYCEIELDRSPVQIQLGMQILFDQNELYALPKQHVAIEMMDGTSKEISHLNWRIFPAWVLLQNEISRQAAHLGAHHSLKSLKHRMNAHLLEIHEKYAKIERERSILLF